MKGKTDYSELDPKEFSSLKAIPIAICMNFSIIKQIQRLRVENKLKDADSIIKEWITENS